MTVAVIVPLTTDDPDRTRAWNYLQLGYSHFHPTWQIVTGTCQGNWCKATAVADALTRTDADVLVVADADAWCNETAEFVERVEAGVWEWAAPHRRIIRLNQQATERVYQSGIPDATPNPRDLTQSVYDGLIGGGIVILPRALYERCPLDPRFEGWGGEDESWGRALLTLTRKRVQGRNNLWHLWHRPQTRLNRRVGNTANDELRARYQRAAGDPDATLALIEEGRCHSTASSSAT